MIYKIPIILLCIIFLNGCPGEEPVKPDPCEGKHPVTADFHIYEVSQLALPDRWELYDTDTVAAWDVVFKALEENAEYEWHLGSEIIYEKQFHRTKFPLRTNIPVTLIVRKEPDTECFPDDDGIDTLTRSFYTLGYTDEGCKDINLFSGNFSGYNIDNPSDTFVVTIDACYLPDGEQFRTLRLMNLTPDCDIYDWTSVFGAYKEIYINNYYEYDCLTPEGIMLISGKNNDTLTIKYSLQVTPGWENRDNRIEKEFKGVRLP